MRATRMPHGSTGWERSTGNAQDIGQIERRRVTVMGAGYGSTPRRRRIRLFFDRLARPEQPNEHEASDKPADVREVGHAARFGRRDAAEPAD